MFTVHKTLQNRVIKLISLKPGAIAVSWHPNGMNLHPLENNSKAQKNWMVSQMSPAGKRQVFLTLKLLSWSPSFSVLFCPSSLGFQPLDPSTLPWMEQMWDIWPGCPLGQQLSTGPLHMRKIAHSGDHHQSQMTLAFTHSSPRPCIWGTPQPLSISLAPFRGQRPLWGWRGVGNLGLLTLKLCSLPCRNLESHSGDCCLACLAFLLISKWLWWHQ